MEIGTEVCRRVRPQDSLTLYRRFRCLHPASAGDHRSYEVVRDNLETLYGAISDGALAVRTPKHARRELEAYLGCGIPSSPPPHRPLRRGAGSSEPVAIAHRAASEARRARAVLQEEAPLPSSAWAELLARTFGVDALACSACRGRMRFVALIRNPASIARYLAGIGEATELPARSPDRGPPYWASTILRHKALGDHDA